MKRLENAIDRLKAWYCEDALPHWITHGYDGQCGGFFESLDFSGRPIADQPRRVRAQSRQIHTLSQAGIRGWRNDAERVAARGFDFFLDRACPDEGRRGCVHVLSPDGSVLDDKRDLYDQAFLLLACASRWEAAKDQRALVLADRTIKFLNTEVASPHGGWREDDANTLPRRQNPHMHLLEAFCALYRVTENPTYLSHAAHIVDLFEQKFFDQQDGVLIEYFDEKLEAHPKKRHLLEPGHMVEWVWLLDRYSELNGASPPPFSDRMLEKAVEIGRDPSAPAFLVNVCNLGEAPGGPRRLWPQTEYLKASIVQARKGQSGAQETAATIIEQLFETYFAVETPGLWCDEFNADGAPIAKDVPASIPYHIHEAVACCEDFLKAKSR